jgi:hypothetical protein
MGAQLKGFLSQKTIIYTGYSLSDPNYRAIATTIAKMIRPYKKQAYFVAPRIDHVALGKFPITLCPIETDGSYFLEQIRVHLEDEVGIIKDEAFDACERFLGEIAEAHNRTAEEFCSRWHPLLPNTLAFQDGVIHGLQRIRDRRHSGEYHSSDHVARLAEGYLHKEESYDLENDLWNSSYANGYGTAMLYLLAQNGEHKNASPPTFGYYEDAGFYSLSALLRFQHRKVKNEHVEQAKRIYSQMSAGNERMVPDHTPYC